MLGLPGLRGREWTVVAAAAGASGAGLLDGLIWAAGRLAQRG